MSYVEKLKRMAASALASADTLPEQQLWWDGYQQALTDVENPPSHAEDEGGYDPMVKVQANLWRPA